MPTAADSSIPSWGTISARSIPPSVASTSWRPCDGPPASSLPLQALEQGLGHFKILVLAGLLPRLQHFLLPARAGDPERLQVPAGDVALLAKPFLLDEVLRRAVRERRERLDLVGERDQDLERRRGRLVSHRQAELARDEGVRVGELLAGDLDHVELVLPRRAQRRHPQVDVLVPQGLLQRRAPFGQPRQDPERAGPEAGVRRLPEL